MKQYFEQMEVVGRELKKGEIKRSEDNIQAVKDIEAKIASRAEEIKNFGIPSEKVNSRGSMTVYQRIEYLVDKETWCPLHTLYNPANNEKSTTNVVDGIGKISGRWAVVIGFDNKYLAGAWIPGQYENILRCTDLAKRLNIPLVWLVHCSGAKLDQQETFYAGRRCSGTTFFRHAELNQGGVPVFAAVYGTNPAGGGYQSISPTVIFAHKDANMAVGGAGIVSGMAPKGGFDTEIAEELIEVTRKFQADPPGSCSTHHDVTGFFRHVYDDDKAVMDGLKEYMAGIPAYDAKILRAAEPKSPAFAEEELRRVIPVDGKKVYDFKQVLARIVDGSEQMEFRPDYGPEVYTGLCKIDGFLVGVIGNNQGFLQKGYPEYADYPGIGGKLYRQGMIKIAEFLTLCDRDRLPIIWMQDTTGIDVGDIAEQAELLGLGQSVNYSTQNYIRPHMMVQLRKGNAAAHYVMGGPQSNSQNAFTIGTAATEINVMHGETAAVAMYSRRLVKEKDAGNSLDPVIEKMNAMVDDYTAKSRPEYCASAGYVDEIVNMTDIRKYMAAFAGAAYQNPSSLCPQHQMILPRIIKG